MNDSDRIITIPTPQNGGMDPASVLAMQNGQQFNNPWAYLILLALFQNGGFGGGGNSDRFAELQAQINDNSNTALINSSLQGNSFAMSQLAQNLNVDYNALTQAINTVNMGILQTANQTGMGFAGVTAAIQAGNLNMIQQLKDCCCGMQTQLLNQGYQNQIQTIEQTNDLQTSLRVENGLTRAEIASFRQAWENGRYADLLEQKNELQNRLNLLELQGSTAAQINTAIAPVTKDLESLSFRVNTMAAHQMPTYAQAYIPGFPVGGAFGYDFSKQTTATTTNS